MKTNFILPLLSFLLLTACSDSEENIQSAFQPALYQVNETTIVNRKTPCAQGYLNGQLISWEFGWNTFQSFGSSSAYPDHPVGMLTYGLNAENNVDNHFQITTPNYDTSSPEQLAYTFSIGEKELGDIGSDFYIRFEKGGKVSESRTGLAGKIKILKTQEYIEQGSNMPYIRVWFRVMNAKLQSHSGSIVRFDGVIIAQFYNYKHF